jgi:hypothetical protein
MRLVGALTRRFDHVYASSSLHWGGVVFQSVGLMDLQGSAVRRALHGWIYAAPLTEVSVAKNARQFRRDVSLLNKRDFLIKGDEEIDDAAADLYDAIMLWARALSHVRAQQGTPRNCSHEAVGSPGIDSQVTMDRQRMRPHC